jgi:hypothetical protein
MACFLRGNDRGVGSERAPLAIGRRSPLSVNVARLAQPRPVTFVQRSIDQSNTSAVVAFLGRGARWQVQGRKGVPRLREIVISPSNSVVVDWASETPAAELRDSGSAGRPSVGDQALSQSAVDISTMIPLFVCPLDSSS